MKRSSLLVGAAIACAAGALAFGGDLNPPAGPVSPTPGPEPRIAINAANTPGDEDSLFKIAQPGSYYLTGNITGVAAKSGIEVGVDDVTIDLMGFALMGVPGSGSGIEVLGRRAAIRNGHVSGWGGDGIDGVFGGIIEGIVASGNTGSGISGAYATISRCVARSNGGQGIGVGSSVITDCASKENAGIGIGNTSGITQNCQAYSNGGDGIWANDTSTIRDCVSMLNAGNGIHVRNTCLIQDNLCRYNGLNAADGAGIYIEETDCRVEGNICIGADRGIDVDSAGNFISRNVCSGNTTNWTVVVGNVCLVVSAATNAMGINGNSGGTAPGSTDPNANFTY